MTRYPWIGSAGSTTWKIEAFSRPQLSGIGLLSATFVFIGPRCVALLANGSGLRAPLALYVGFGLLSTIFAWQVPTLAALGGAEGTRLVARWIPLVAGVNLVASVALVHLGVWAPTAVSVVVSIMAHIALFVVLNRASHILKVRHAHG